MIYHLIGSDGLKNIGAQNVGLKSTKNIFVQCDSKKRGSKKQCTSFGLQPIKPLSLTSNLILEFIVSLAFCGGDVFTNL